MLLVLNLDKAWHFMEEHLNKMLWVKVRIITVKVMVIDQWLPMQWQEQWAKDLEVENQLIMRELTVRHLSNPALQKQHLSKWELLTMMITPHLKKQRKTKRKRKMLIWSLIEVNLLNIFIIAVAFKHIRHMLFWQTRNYGH